MSLDENIDELMSRASYSALVQAIARDIAAWQRTQCVEAWLKETIKNHPGLGKKELEYRLKQNPIYNAIRNAGLTK